MESINTESPLKLPISLPGKSKKNNFVKFDTHAKKRTKETKSAKKQWVESRKLQVCKKRRGEKEEQHRMDMGCGFTGACRGRPVGNWHWHIDWSFQTPKRIASWLIKSCLNLCVACQSWLPLSPSSLSSSSTLCGKKALGEWETQFSLGTKANAFDKLVSCKTENVL